MTDKEKRKISIDLAERITGEPDKCVVKFEDFRFLLSLIGEKDAELKELRIRHKDFWNRINIQDAEIKRLEGKWQSSEATLGCLEVIHKDMTERAERAEAEVERLKEHLQDPLRGCSAWAEDADKLVKELDEQ